MKYTPMFPSYLKHAGQVKINVKSLIPESDKCSNFSSQSILWIKYLSHENKWNDQQLEQSSWWFYKFSLLEPRKCIENSMENIHNDVRV